MIIIGEKLNSSIPATQDALLRHDGGYMAELVRAQAAAGADYLDINTAMAGERERDDMLWLAGIALAECGCGIMIDTVRPEVALAAAELMNGREFIVNSVSADSRTDELAPMIASCGAGVVVLPMRGAAFPHTADERAANAAETVGKLTAAGVARENIYIDILTLACATDGGAARTALSTLAAVKRALPGVRTVAGASNVSFGLPVRAALNRAYLAMLMAGGIDAVITDAASASVRETAAAANALLGNDEYCMEYIDFCRKNK